MLQRKDQKLKVMSEISHNGNIMYVYIYTHSCADLILDILHHVIISYPVISTYMYSNMGVIVSDTIELLVYVVILKGMTPQLHM